MHLKPLSISHFALSFFFVLAIILGISSWFMLHEMGKVKEEVRQSNYQAAHHELTLAIDELIQSATQAGNKLAAWDEVRQQIYDPAYYDYWHRSRLSGSGLLPAAIDSVDIYDSKGKNLSRISGGESSMPAQIPLHALGAILHKGSGHDHLYYFFPIWADEGKRQLAGYGGFKLDFIADLQRLRTLRYVDLKSVSVDARVGQQMLPAEILPHLKFKLITNPATNALEAVMR